MLSVSELTEYDGLPQEFLDVLPVECIDCGAETVITEALTGLSCVNPVCTGKIAVRVKALLTDTGVKDFGDARIDEFVDYFQLTNPINVLDFREEHLWEGASIKTWGKILRQIEKVRNTPIELYKFVQLCHLPGIQSSAKDLFGDYTELDSFYSDMEDGGIEWVANKLGIQTDSSIRSFKVYSTLLEYKDDLYEGIDIVTIDVPNLELPQLVVVCSDQVGGGYSTKREFYTDVEQRAVGKYRVEFKGSVTKSIDCLVWAGADGSPARYTSKVQKVEGWNNEAEANNGRGIPIVTAGQFLARYGLA